MQVDAQVQKTTASAGVVLSAVTRKHPPHGIHAMTPVELGIIGGLAGTLFLLLVLLCSVCNIRRDQKRSHTTGYAVSREALRPMPRISDISQIS
ncbi:hypothetical protein CABS03_15257 [Colletotrichum abscissum]|uniref:Uncharacterized protein n=1 Tax=Colletotrichum limetticola TaxID=1209924 RepID=A0ABQ9PAS2_9PEZI|nr:hypothetical protein CLIM01_14408 [Colletotrichum limetticola]